MALQMDIEPEAVPAVEPEHESIEDVAAAAVVVAAVAVFVPAVATELD